MGLQGNKLSPIYYSLSQTYKDNKQYELSVEYSRKEFELIKDNPPEVSA
jgi:NF-kappa-B inhibitor-like protein 2